MHRAWFGRMIKDKRSFWKGYRSRGDKTQSVLAPWLFLSLALRPQVSTEEGTEENVQLGAAACQWLLRLLGVTCLWGTGSWRSIHPIINTAEEGPSWFLFSWALFFCLITRSFLMKGQTVIFVYVLSIPQCLDLRICLEGELYWWVSIIQT